MPGAETVSRFMTALGEWGLLGVVNGLAVGRPKAWFFNRPLNQEEKNIYRAQQQAAIIRHFRAYNSKAPVVLNLAFGHTDPQFIIPYGGMMTIDAENRKVFVELL